MAEQTTPPFTVLEIRCLHSSCWAAKCECGAWLTKHDFDAAGAERSARDALTRTDRWGHRCHRG